MLRFALLPESGLALTRADPVVARASNANVERGGIRDGHHGSAATGPRVEHDGEHGAGEAPERLDRAAARGQRGRAELIPRSMRPTDPGRLFGMLPNLLSNALRAGSRGDWTRARGCETLLLHLVVAGSSV